NQIINLIINEAIFLINKIIKIKTILLNTKISINLSQERDENHLFIMVMRKLERQSEIFLRHKVGLSLFLNHQLIILPRDYFNKCLKRNFAYIFFSRCNRTYAKAR
ncbi:MAG: hypothetical protein AAF208_07895, partial [Cyanobacteria bacterium P01_A01_bin.45]